MHAVKLSCMLGILLALVVRAPQSLHGDIGPLLGQLRRQ